MVWSVAFIGLESFCRIYNGEPPPVVGRMLCGQGRPSRCLPHWRLQSYVVFGFLPREMRFADGRGWVLNAFCLFYVRPGFCSQTCRKWPLNGKDFSFFRRILKKTFQLVSRNSGKPYICSRIVDGQDTSPPYLWLSCSSSYTMS